ncbi:hypothetical protein ACOMHN_006078 [Nucella lapillus]
MIPKHHIKQEVCTTRPSYRDGRRLTTVKVYTAHQESKYLLVQNVPAVGAKDQLAKLLAAYGEVEDLHPLDEYPADKFTEVYLVKFKKIQSARFAKKKLDDYSFFAGSLHICYAPEYETVKETRQKLQDRRRVVAAKIRKLEQESESASSVGTTTKSSASTSSSSGLSLTSQLTPALPPPPPLTFQHPPPPTFQHPPPPTFQHPPPSAFQHPPPPAFRPSPPPGPPPPLTTAADSCMAPPPTSSLPSVFHPGFGNQRPPHVTAAVPSQRTATLPPGCGLGRVDLRGHGVEHAMAFSDLTFQIPPPPMPGVSFDAGQHRTPHFTRRDYGFAWVPSANSNFPPGYDPRLPQGGGEVDEDGEADASVQGRDGARLSSSTTDSAGDNDRLQLVRSTPHAHSHQPLQSLPPSKPNNSTAESSAKNSVSSSSKVIVKQYKPKGPPPRFVPRQINKDSREIKSGGASAPSSADRKKEEDEVNREIRREAFRLEKDQGPSLPSDPETREQFLGQRPLVDPKVEASVVTSVKAIRKRMSKFISETVPKQLKRSAERQSSKTSSDGGNTSVD